MRVLPAFLCCVALLQPSSALAWSPLRAPNPNVEKGNALMAEENHAEALSAYDEAARELPAERGIQLNRGLALLAQDLTEPAKEAFTAAADPSAPPEIRADAYYDLGVAFAREGDALSEEEDFEGATAHFREAADAFKRSLRARPGNRDAAWNLEYALERIREEEEKQKQAEEQQQQESQEQEQEEEQEQEQGQEEGQEQGEGQDQEAGQEQESEDEADSGDQNEEQSESGEDPESESETGDENESEGQREERSESSERNEQSEQGLRPSQAERFLDALEENEESLPLQRARRRSAGRRPPEKDW
jgi:tetratricopeptide (TPR) repeat protein